MNKNEQIAEKIGKIGDKTFSKLKKLQIPPYPKYYHDTFMDILIESDNKEVLDLSKKYNHLFSSNEIDEILQDSCFRMTKESISEFENSNSNLKNISSENIIDIDEIKEEPSSIDAKKIVMGFDNFQKQIVKELENADITINRLKLEIEKLEKESNIDPLTKTYNRRGLIRDLEEILEAGKEKNLDMQLVIIDADDFKKINDTLGHIAGDKTLIYITKLIKNSIRKGIRIYRYGGEEFIIILNHTSQDDGVKITERIIKNADESKLLYKGNTIHLTLSAGISRHIKGDTVESIIERADSALYTAKNAGKNCCELG
jgi:diguanylate cyclase (GGDEF)-like protein